MGSDIWYGQDGGGYQPPAPLCPEGYAEMMDKLADPDGWDVPGLIADLTRQVAEEYHNGGEIMAVIDTLCFALRDIDQCIRTGRPVKGQGTRVISADTIREAGQICARFTGKPSPAFVMPRPPEPPDDFDPRTGD